MTEAERGTREWYVAAALAALDRYGSADPSMALSVNAIAAGGGVTRSTIYRNWETVAEMNDDIASYIICHRAGWLVRLLEQPVDQPFVDALEAAIGHPQNELGVLARAAASSWPPEKVARRNAITWEQAVLEILAGWVEAHCVARGRAFTSWSSARVAALGVVSLIEGQVIVMAFKTSPTFPGWDDDRRRQVCLVADRFLTDTTEPVDNIDPKAQAEARNWRAAALPRPEITATGLAILERAYDTYLAAPSSVSLQPAPGRVVDIGRLARELEVSERRIYGVWPTAADMHADLLTALIIRQRVTAEDLASTVLAIGFDDQYATFEELNVSALHALVRAARHPGGANYFACALAAAADEVVRERASEALESWQHSIRTSFLAILALMGRYRRTSISPEEYSSRMVDCTVGMQRLASLDHALLDESVDLGSTTLPLCGLVVYQVGSSMVSDEPPSATGPLPKRSAPRIEH